VHGVHSPNCSKGFAASGIARFVKFSASSTSKDPGVGSVDLRRGLRALALPPFLAFSPVQVRSGIFRALIVMYHATEAHGSDGADAVDAGDADRGSSRARGRYVE
jgi:hypothetical protein